MSIKGREIQVDTVQVYRKRKKKNVLSAVRLDIFQINVHQMKRLSKIEIELQVTEVAVME